MKTSLYLSAFCAALLSCNIKSEHVLPASFAPKEGKETITSKEFNVNFDEIKVVQSISAEVIKSDTEKVVISAPQDILEDILVENNNGKLLIRFKPGLQISARNVHAKIFAKDFHTIEAASSARIDIKNQFTQDKTEVEVSSSAQISGNLEANELSIDVSSSGLFSGKVWAVNLEAEVSSSGSIQLSGKTKNAELDASSSGTLNATKLMAENAEVKATSSGSVSISAINQLSATASSSGSIEVLKKGPLNIITQNSNSGGRIAVR